MNILQLEKDTSLDFYKDYYNLLTPSQKSNLFYQTDYNSDDMTLEDIENMKPDEFFQMYYPTNNENETEKEVLFELINILQMDNIKEALNSLVEKWIIDDFSSDVWTYQWLPIVDYYFHKSLDEWGIINYEVSSINEIFNDCKFQAHYENALEKNLWNFIV